MCKQILTVLCLLFLQSTHAQTSFHAIYLLIPDTTIIASVTTQGKPVFTISGINTIVNQYTVTGFHQAFPSSRYYDMRRVYRMNVSDTALPKALVNTYPQYILHWEYIPEPVLLGYSPIDLQDDISIYPNPANSYIVVENTSSYTIQGLSLYSIGGGKLLPIQTTPNTNRLYTEGLADGLYFLRISFDNYSHLTKKIIIQH